MPSLTDIARLPHSDDNAAIACADLDAGLRIRHNNCEFTLTHSVLLGHRFAIGDITTGQALLSWGQPFGYALNDIQAGDYLCNDQVLIELGSRALPFSVPEKGNFRDFYQPHTLGDFTPGTQVACDIDDLSFEGFDRGPRGVGTRNCIAVLPVSAHASALADKIAEHFKSVVDNYTNNYTNIDAVVSLAHTEAAAGETTYNKDKVIQTLAGFAVHPNIAAVFIIDAPQQLIAWSDLQQCISDHNMPWNDVLHKVVSMQTSARTLFSQAVSTIESWLPQVNACTRSTQPASRLRIALQCGGSDAFSGISGNPLAGSIAKQIIRCGGAANLAETSELAGAEAYILDNCRDRSTAEKFLEYNIRYRTVAENHGHTLEGNPSGGNFYRGLYNIALKSLGAAMKKPDDVRLDYVSDYGEHCTQPGYYFMDSPGNDLESVAGQVAWGANIILFVTGNGSVTNFPFVPTLKIITTTSRYELLRNEMDINAGVYLDDTDMDTLTNDSFDLVRAVASGQPCLGEKAGHSQVSIWRSWRLNDGSSLASIIEREAANGNALTLSEKLTVIDINDRERIRIPAMRHAHGVSAVGHALVLPTSLCSGQVAQLICEQLNYTATDADRIQSFISLVHTEGCGSSSGRNVDMLLRNYASYIRHPDIVRCCLLEHGCEKVHNQYVIDYLHQENIQTAALGHASIQLDGGIEKVSAKVRTWFQEAAQNDSNDNSELEDCTLSEFCVAFDCTNCADTTEEKNTQSQQDFISLIEFYLRNACTVIIPSTSPLLPALNHLIDGPIRSTLEYGQRPNNAGLHIMHCTGRITAENTTGLAACGAQMICMHIESLPVSGHPFVPVLQLSNCPQVIENFSEDIDSTHIQNGHNWQQLSIDCLAHTYTTQVMQAGLTQFQMSRGETGISM